MGTRRERGSRPYPLPGPDVEQVESERPARSGPAARGEMPVLLADVRQQAHEPGPLDRRGQGPLVGGAGAGALAAEQLALAGAHLLQIGHVLVIDEGRPRAALFGAEPAAVLLVPSQLLADHAAGTPECPSPTDFVERDTVETSRSSGKHRTASLSGVSLLVADRGRGVSLAVS